MKTKLTLLASLLSASALSSFAQLTPSPTGGVNLFNAPSAFNAQSYSDTLGPGGKKLYYASQAEAPSTEVNSWNFVTQSSDLNITWRAGGGSVKTIFLGESAGSANDFGFIKSGADLNDVNSYTPLITDIVHSGNPGDTIRSGWETYASYGAGERLDFWLNNPGTFEPGGTYFSFLENGVGSTFADGDPYTHVKFSWTTVRTQYMDNGVMVEGDVDTLLIAYEDLRGPALPPGAGLPNIPPGDADYTDFIVGFQFLPEQSSVPEPSTYGLFGAASLMALLGYRRFKASAKA